MAPLNSFKFKFKIVITTKHTKKPKPNTRQNDIVIVAPQSNLDYFITKSTNDVN